MIVAQQSYQANAKALTTMDQVDQATLQMITECFQIYVPF